MSESRKPFPFSQFEPKWQSRWDAENTFRTPNPGEASFDVTKPKYYVLDMFPYPSGAGLHVGHPEGYTATDIIGRYKRMRGFNVLHPMGYDSFGLPAEQYAIKTGQHPAITTATNIENFRRQLKSLGFAYDWEREIATTDPEYVRWTQWIFLEIYNSYFCEETNRARPISELEAKGWSREQIDAERLAFVADTPVWWSPDLGTVLANEEVEEWKSKGHTVERRPLRQWMLRITKYAQRLIDELDTLDWPEGIKLLQKNWIGRSEGAEVKFQICHTAMRNDSVDKGSSLTLTGHSNFNSQVEVFTTRPDTLFGATYMVLAPEHPYVPLITTEENKSAVEIYQKSIASKSDLDRGDLNKDKSGVFTGAYAVNPVNGEQIPIWIADYVMMGYGTGAIMAVPAHDDRDFEFAQRFELPIKQVVQGERGRPARFFSSESTVAETKHKLPHWQQGETACFVTWRLDDSLPKEIIEKWEAERNTWLEFNPKPWGEALEKEYHEKFSDRLDEWLDSGAGSCALKDPSIRKVVSDALTHFDSERYTLHAFVVMPNHVHVLFSPLDGHELADILHSWKSFTSKQIGNQLGKDGRFWQPEYYDQLIRNERHFFKVVEYILENPVKARLSVDAFTLWTGENAGGTPALPYTAAGTAVNSCFLDGLSTADSKKKIIDWLVSNNQGKRKIQFKLRDWLFSRQRYWGEPFPIIWKDGQHYALPDDQLPLLAPPLDDYKPSGTPDPLLSKATEWVNLPDGFTRETNTMPQWAGSCWYYLRYCDNKNSDRFISKEAEAYWTSDKPGMVDLYVGGTEHAVLHLLYARFWHKVLFDLGHVSTPEPFQKLVNQGLILGEDGQKMSKSRGNVVNPDDVVKEYGADSLRLYEMFMGPLEQVKPWQMKGVEGVSRFLARVWRLAITEEGEVSDKVVSEACTDKELSRVVHETIKKVGEDIEKLSFNTAISQMMICTNAFTQAGKVPVKEFIQFLTVLNPFAPHLSEEINEHVTKAFNLPTASLSESVWPAYDEQALIRTECELVVQVNGKLRDRIWMAMDASEDDAKALAFASEKIKELTEGKELRKVIYVPGKIMNLVVS
jgi:leucyl-tRNA synthetase/REP element-mobilizing transposase RayT